MIQLMKIQKWWKDILFFEGKHVSDSLEIKTYITQTQGSTKTILEM